MKVRIDRVEVLHNPVANPPYRGVVVYTEVYGWFFNDSYQQHVEAHTYNECLVKAWALANHIKTNRWHVVTEVTRG